MFFNFQGEKGCENFKTGLTQTPKLYSFSYKITNTQNRR